MKTFVILAAAVAGFLWAAGAFWLFFWAFSYKLTDFGLACVFVIALISGVASAGFAHDDFGSRRWRGEQ